VSKFKGKVVNFVSQRKGEILKDTRMIVAFYIWAGTTLSPDNVISRKKELSFQKFLFLAKVIASLV
jgi:hypothetical protein